MVSKLELKNLLFKIFLKEMEKVSAEEKAGKKSQAILEFIVTYGWTILAILMIVGLVYFGIWIPAGVPTQDVVVDSESELLEICNKLVVNNEVYPFLEVMGKGLKEANGAQFVAYKFPAELRSNLDIFNVDGLILCGVPTELCYTENNDIKGGTYCILMRLEVPVVYQDFGEWYRKVWGFGEDENAEK